jgi:hypothetical protein
MSPIAGNNIVSPYIVIKIVEPKIARMAHVDTGILSDFSISEPFIID